MRYSANLNIIIKAIEKASSRLSRDFIELENLQTNPFSANKFANACYNKVKQLLAEDLHKIRPEFNLIFSDGQKIISNKNAEYSYIIFPIDGLNNLSHSSPDFTMAIAIEHHGADGKKEAISVAISKLIGGELYYCEKGFGAYLNNRRIRVSKRTASEELIAIADNQNALLEVTKKSNIKKFSQRTYGCKTMEIAYLAAAKCEIGIFDSNELLQPFLLLIREAGGKIIESEKLAIASSGVISN